MRRFLAFATVLALTACGGGGGSSPSGPSTPVTAPTSAPGTTSSNLVTPQFTIRVPASGAKTSSVKRSPKYISPSTLSVTITLTNDNAGAVAPGSITGNPATTNIPAGSCAGGCTVPGPPSPPGSDTFTITTFDATNGTGTALSTATATLAITAGTANSNPVTLNGIVASIAISGVPAANAFAAGTTNSSTLSITASDADGNTITGTYSNAVTVSDPDTLSDGSSVAATTCPAQGTEATVASSSVNLTSSTTTAKFCYNGIAENPVTLTSSAAGVTGVNAGTASFQPLLSAPAYVAASGTPAGVVDPVTGEIDLFATSGLGSTGSANFAETGWTTAPFNQALTAAASGTCSSGGPLSTFATLSTAAAVGATTITATATGSPVAGLCSVTVSDGLTANTSDATGSLNVSYTTTTIPVNGHRRVTH